MSKFLFFISILLVSTVLVLAQAKEKPVAYLFDEFGVIRDAEVKIKTTRLREKLRQTAWSEKPDSAYLMFFYEEKKTPSLKIRNIVRDTLFENCRDCLGFSPQITFVEIGNSKEQKVQFWIVPFGADRPNPEVKTLDSLAYPAIWFAAINDPNKPDWEILPQEAKAGEVILSKRNELGILSNFAATPFELYGKRYASVEGFWQMMLYPEMGPEDFRARQSAVQYKLTREQVAQMTGFEAKSAGTLAEENMKTLGIDWCSFEGKKFPYRSATPGEHYRLIVAAMRAKLEQNPDVKRILLATGDLILKPDHHGEENPPPEWKYYDIWMQIRKELTADKRK